MKGDLEIFQRFRKVKNVDSKGLENRRPQGLGGSNPSPSAIESRLSGRATYVFLILGITVCYSLTFLVSGSLIEIISKS